MTYASTSSSGTTRTSTPGSSAGAGIRTQVSTTTTSQLPPSRSSPARSARTGSSSTVLSTSASVPQAHPQAVEPTAGVVASQAAADPSAPVGDPTAHAPSLADVKKELKILNLCGGATNSAFAQPLIKVSGP